MRSKSRYGWRDLMQAAGEGVLVVLGLLLSLAVTDMIAKAAHWLFGF